MNREENIIPIIEDGVKKLEMLDDKGKIQELDMQFDGVRTDFEEMSLDELAGLHKKITLLERNVQAVDNFLKYYKGLIYISVRNMGEAEVFTKWIQNHCVSKTTVYKYIAFTTLIMRFPRLILCDLNFSQLVKHKERILSYMCAEKNSKLAHQLSDNVEFRVGTSTMLINCVEVEVPHLKGASVAVDWRFYDEYEDVDLSHIQPIQTEGAMSISSMEDELM